jgi:hypothetical protein
MIKNLIDPEAWSAWIENNQDPYGGACVKVAEKVMEYLDDPDRKIDAYKMISEADKESKAGGITGFMAGAVAQMVATCHARGDEFRRDFNKEFGVEEEKAQGGVVNPAILTIDV